MNSYFEEVQALLTIVEEQEKQSIKESVEHIAKAVMSDGIIHLFGSGHSHILTEEVFYRAGLVGYFVSIHEFHYISF